MFRGRAAVERAGLARMEIRRLTLADLPACLTLAVENGWPADETRWRLLLSVGEGWCAGAPEGGLAGAIVICDYGGRVAVLAMPLLARRHARPGLDRMLAERALARAGSAVALLYATAEGAALYESIGFWQAGAVARYAGTPSPVAPPPDHGDEPVQLRPVGGADFTPLAAFDEEAFGAPRANLLERLLPIAERVCLAVRGGALVGYGIAWPAADAVVVGPVVAADPAAALALTGWLAAGHDLPVRLDVPTGSPALHAWASASGLRWQGTAPLLAHAERSLPGRRERIHAIAARALG